jgi:hypothetical protein
MAQPQLSVRSARARDLAHRLAKQERRTVAQVVEKALEAYADSKPGEAQSWSTFIDDLLVLPRDPHEKEIDLETIIREHRAPHQGIDLE